jgi:hypothetical protein
LEVNGGLLHAARSLEEHIGQLAASCALDGARDVKAERFVSGFVRPFGRHEPATPRFADAVEEVLASASPAPESSPFTSFIARAGLLPILGGMLLSSPALRARTREKARKRAKRFSRERSVRSKRPRTVEARD